MAVKGASSVVDRDWISWESLAREGAAVLISVKSIEAPKDYGNGDVEAVVARVIVLTGKQAGEVFPSERILKAGIRSKLTEVGADVVGRLGFYGARKNVGLEDEAEGDIELAEKALKKHGAVKTSSNGSAPAADESGDDSDEPPF